MAQFCTECGTAVGPGKKFCTGCGAKVEAAGFSPADAYKSAQPFGEAEARAPQNGYFGQPVQTFVPERDTVPGASLGASAIQPDAKPVGVFAYLGRLTVMCIPLVGLVMSIVWGVESPPTNRGNLAKAMIVVNVIWLIVFVLFIIWAYSLFSQLSRVVNISFDIFGLKIF